MATTSAVIATVSNILKRRYLGPVQDQMNNAILVTQILPVESAPIKQGLTGLQAELPLHSIRTGGVGSRGELDTLPGAGAQGYAKAVYDLKYHYGRLQVSGQALYKTSDSVGAFLEAYKSELEGLRDDLTLDFARQIYGDGTAIIASITDTATSVTPTLGSSEAIEKEFLYIGMRVDIGTAANPVLKLTAAEIVDVNVTTPSITLDSSFTHAATDKVFRSGNAEASSVVNEMDVGLQNLISTGAATVGGINDAGAGNSFWQNLRDATGGAISLSSLLVNWNKSFAKGGKAANIVAVTTPGIARRLFESADFKSNVRFVSESDRMNLKGGFEMLSFNAGSGTINLVADRLHPYGKLHFVDKRFLRMFSPGDWDFLAKDGLNVKWVSDKDAFQSILFRYANLGTNRRNTSVVMSGLTDTGY